MWLADVGLGKRAQVKGKTIDLNPHLPALAAEGLFRRMVIRAAIRNLEKRGASVVVPFEELEMEGSTDDLE